MEKAFRVSTDLLTTEEAVHARARVTDAATAATSYTAPELTTPGE
jgi:hypothetical protein